MNRKTKLTFIVKNNKYYRACYYIGIKKIKFILYIINKQVYIK